MIHVPKTVPIINTSVEQRNRFDCGNKEINKFLKKYSEANHLKKIGRTFVLVANEEIVGYYTVSMGSTVEFLHVYNEDILPKYPIPIGLIGKLAVSKNNQNQGWGKWLLIDAIRKISKASDDIGAYAIVVDAKDESAKNFYLQYGFLIFPNKPLSLYLPMESISPLVK